MNPTFEHGGVSSYCGDNRAILATLPEKSVQTCVTSPPYFGLRNYNGGDAEIGLESTPDEYVAALVEVFRAVHRVLKDDGTCWINLGDSYAGSGKGPEGNIAKGQTFRHMENIAPRHKFDIKPKSLCMIPARVAIALEADGWYLRSDIIWSKKNPMPESVTDRPTKAHEYIFLLSKSAKYYYDADAIREPHSENTHGGNTNGARSLAHTIPDRTFSDRSTLDTKVLNPNGRNKRSVWTVATSPCKEAHFATFPQKLIEPCILAGSAKGDTVLDPFFGSGTTGLVSRQLGRKCIGIDLNPDYLLIQQKRLNVAQNILCEVAA